MNLIIKIKFLFSAEYWIKNYKKISTSFFAFLGITWLLIETINYFFDTTVIKSTHKFWLLFGLAMLLSVITNLEKLTYDYFIRGKDVKIKLVIGDLFKQNGDIVLATNTTFDTTLKDDFISKNSIQGQLLLKYYQDEEQLNSEIDNALINIESCETLNREKSKCKRYPIGTIIKLNHSKFKSYWLALADINEFGKPISNFSDFQNGLEALWTYITTNGHMNRLVLPILGSGRSAMNISRDMLIKEIISSFVIFSQEKKITEDLIICISPNDYVKKNIDLCEINKFLEFYCSFNPEINKVIHKSTDLK